MLPLPLSLFLARLQVQVQSILYNTAENIVRECGEKIDDKELIDTWTDAAVKLLTLPSVAPDLQEAASGLMVALGSNPKHCSAVSSYLLNS